MDRKVTREDNVIHVDFSQPKTEEQEVEAISNSMSKDFKKIQRVVFLGSTLSIGAALTVFIVLAVLLASI
jgi:hypothetical protein